MQHQNDSSLSYVNMRIKKASKNCELWIVNASEHLIFFMLLLFELLVCNENVFVLFFTPGSFELRLKLDPFCFSGWKSFWLHNNPLWTFNWWMLTRTFLPKALWNYHIFCFVFLNWKKSKLKDQFLQNRVDQWTWKMYVSYLPSTRTTRFLFVIILSFLFFIYFFFIFLIFYVCLVYSDKSFK